MLPWPHTGHLKKTKVSKWDIIVNTIQDSKAQGNISSRIPVPGFRRNESIRREIMIITIRQAGNNMVKSLNVLAHFTRPSYILAISWGDISHLSFSMGFIKYKILEIYVIIL